MGVKGFNTWFRKQFPGAYVGVKRQYDHLYIDMASFLHEELRKAEDVDHFHMRLHARLDKTLKLVDPRKSVVFALDGPAPLAKLLTQRMRRRKEAQKEARTGPRPLSSLGLTPGTPLMAMIQESLTYYICRRLQTAKWQHLHFELSGATVKGEGEVKILSRLLRPWADVQPEDTHALIANDSDVVLMALVTPARNVYVLAEPGRVGRRVGPAAGVAAAASKGAQKGRQARAKVAAGARGLPMMGGFTCFSVAALQLLWLKKYPFLRGATPQDTAESLARLQMDLVILVVLSAGNDYLPALVGGRLQGNSLWESYLKLKSNREWAHEPLLTWRDGEARLNAACLTALLKAWPRAQNRYLVSYDEDDTVVYKPPADPLRYLEGLEWFLKMYAEGGCTDYRFTYDAYAPAPSQILSAFAADSLQEASPQAQNLGQDSSETSDAPSAAPLPSNNQAGRLQRISESTEALLPTVCAMALLPGGPMGLAYAPTALRHLMTNPDSPIADLYQDCSQCTALSQESGRLNTERTEAQQVLAAAAKALAAAEAAAAGHKEGLEAAVAQAAVEAATAALAEGKRHVQQIKDQTRALEATRAEHMRLQHPYAPFPIDRLEAAVRAVPLESFPVVQRDAAVFGPAYKFWRGSDSEAASSGFTPPDAPFADAPEEPSRMIEREEIPEVLPVLVQQPTFIDYAAAEGREIEQATSSQTSAKEGKQSSEAGQTEAGNSQQLLQASAGMRHMRRKMGKGKAARRARKPHKPAGLMSNGDLVPREETEARQSSLPGSTPDSTAAALEGRAAAQPWVGRTGEGTGLGATASEMVYSAVTYSGLVMWRPGYRLNTAASCLPSNAPKGIGARQARVATERMQALWRRTAVPNHRFQCLKPIRAFSKPIHAACIR
ncbi:probable 5'-3' exoribonuclease 1 at N-terminal half [Coccomyxa sp. Obi]|nr:probable 5'-3' exoribonuclease 1 at N-terminal half [Coccomyxa sp. Obi]